MHEQEFELYSMMLQGASHVPENHLGRKTPQTRQEGYDWVFEMFIFFFTSLNLIKLHL